MPYVVMSCRNMETDMLKASQQDASHTLQDTAKFIKVLQQGIAAIARDSAPELRATHFVAYLSGALQEIDSTLGDEVGKLINLPLPNSHRRSPALQERGDEERFMQSLAWLADAILEQKLNGEDGACTFVAMLADNLHAAGNRRVADKLLSVLRPDRHPSARINRQ
jgi:hypothetical protein